MRFLSDGMNDMGKKMKGNVSISYQLFLFCRALDMVDALEKFIVAKSV